MNKILLHLVAVVFAITTFSGCARPYTAGEKRAMTAFVGSAVADAYTTRRSLQAGFVERNPFLDDHPSDRELIGLKVAGFALFWGLGEIFPDRRETFWWVGAGSQTAAATYNYCLEQGN